MTNFLMNYCKGETFRMGRYQDWKVQPMLKEAFEKEIYNKDLQCYCPDEMDSVVKLLPLKNFFILDKEPVLMKNDILYLLEDFGKILYAKVTIEEVEEVYNKPDSIKAPYIDISEEKLFKILAEMSMLISDRSFAFNPLLSNIEMDEEYEKRDYYEHEIYPTLVQIYLDHFPENDLWDRMLYYIRDKGWLNIRPVRPECQRARLKSWPRHYLACLEKAFKWLGERDY